MMQDNLGPFVFKELVGQGGMGKVYKAYDPNSQRTVALKVIKDKLLHNPKSKKRFLNEAYIHAKLSHPFIIPIHSIEIHEEGIGYTMPFIEGETLKQKLLKLRESPQLISLKARLRHIMKILEALEYTHKMGYVHRDVKADNIFIGNNEETYLFDWGLAVKIGDSDDAFSDEDDHEQLTKPGKIPGTLTHLAPERALGSKGSIQSDIFSLGVVLYQLLTLKMPFYRKDLDHFKTIAGQETFTPPSSINLREDIDESLDLIVSRALANDLTKRYLTTEEFRHDLQKVLDGLPIWKDPLKLDIQIASHWLYQDILPLGSYLALTQKALSWGLLSVPYVELIDNYKLHIQIPKLSSGFKIFLNLAKGTKSFDLDNCFIIHLDPSKSISLHKVFALIEEKALMTHDQSPLDLVIEKIENHFYVFVNHTLIFEFLSRMPNICPFVGIVVEDPLFHFSKIELYSASSTKQISCLKVGDHLSFHKAFDLARSEYQKIVLSFQDHQEGREALFRMGLSYILEAKQKSNKKNHLLNEGIRCFERFRTQKAAPWEYWGKALCYQGLNQNLEMVKCFELGFRKYPRHIFTHELKEELISIFSQKSLHAKKEALMLAFVALRYLDDLAFFYKYPTLIESLEEELSSCFVLLDLDNLSKKQMLIFSLAYVLKQTAFLEEILQKSISKEEKTNALLILCHLNGKQIQKNSFQDFASLLGVPNLFITPFEKIGSDCWILAKCVLTLFKKIPVQDFLPKTKEAAFLLGLTKIVYNLELQSCLIADQYDLKILQTLSLDKKNALLTLKSPFFQESERFIRSNFIISLLQKKTLDYFGYDKSSLEFAIKALFLRQSRA